MKNTEARKYAYVIIAIGIAAIVGMFIVSWMITIPEPEPIKLQKELQINPNRPQPAPKNKKFPKFAPEEKPYNKYNHDV